MHIIYVTSHGPTSGRAATATGGTWSAQLSTARSVGSEELPLETQRHDVAMNGRKIWTQKHRKVWTRMKKYVKIGNKYGDDMENGRFIDDLANHLAIQKLNLMLFSESEMVLWI